MDTINCEREKIQRIEIPLSLLSDLVKALVHAVRGHLSVVSNDLEYFNTLLPNEVDGTSATARSSRRISETAEILETISALSFLEADENIDKLLRLFFSVLGVTKEEIIQAPRMLENDVSYIVSKSFPDLSQSSFSTAVELAKKSVGEKGVVIAAVLDLLLTAHGTSFQASRTSITAPLEVVLIRSQQGAET